MPNWDYVLKEVQKERDDPSGGPSAHDKVRRKYLKQLHDHRGRNIIAYYSGFLTKGNVQGIEINDEDKNGLMLCIHKLDRKLGLDLILHTPGGNIAATESLVHYLKQMFGNDIVAFVPQLAMSAGTMIACACREIYLGKHSNLGPVDPQFNGIPAFGVLQEIERAYEEIRGDSGRALVWGPILANYPPSFVQQCHWAIERSGEFVRAALSSNMFADLEPAQRTDQVNRIFSRLSDLRMNKGHDKHIHADEAREIGLKIKSLEADKALQDIVLTVHHCYMNSLSNTSAFKLIENHIGRCYARLISPPPTMVLHSMQPPTEPAG